MMAPREINGGGERSSRQACAACKHQRKKCENDCVFASHFPSEQNDRFQAVLNHFGVRNIKKMLSNIPSQLREEAAASFSWEANMWKQDPIHGPLGFYKTLMHENARLKNENHQLKEAINGMQWRNARQGSIETVFIRPHGYNNIMNIGSDYSGNANPNSDVESYTSLLQGQEGNKSEHPREESIEANSTIIDDMLINSPVHNGPFNSLEPKATSIDHMVSSTVQGHPGNQGTASLNYNYAPYWNDRALRELTGGMGVQGGMWPSRGQIIRGQNGANRICINGHSNGSRET